MLRCLVLVVWNTYSGSRPSFSPGLSLDVICFKEIINSLSLTRKTCTTCIMRHVQSEGAGCSEKRSEKRSKKCFFFFYGVLQFPYLTARDAHMTSEPRGGGKGGVVSEVTVKLSLYTIPLITKSRLLEEREIKLSNFMPQVLWARIKSNLN